MKTLSFIVGLHFKVMELIFSFHTLCNYFHSKIMGECDDGMCNRSISRVGTNVTYKAPVYFHSIDGKLLQVSQRGLTSPKVINCQIDTQVPDRMKSIHDRARMVHDHAFC